MNFFTTPSSKNIIATLRIVKIEKCELTFLLVLYFYGFTDQESPKNVIAFSDKCILLILIFNSCNKTLIKGIVKILMLKLSNIASLKLAKLWNSSSNTGSYFGSTG